jgi:hypothetical protein
MAGCGSVALMGTKCLLWSLVGDRLSPAALY